METFFTPPLNGDSIWNSDPTYEAWKPFFPRQNRLIYHHSDPTYEAWKLGNIYENPELLKEDSDPTYEAWKRSCSPISFSTTSYTPILPMRHGNS